MAITRGEKKLGAVCALALAIPLSVAAFISHINATPTLATPPLVKAPQPNGYDLYVRAANAITPANPPVDAVLEIKTITDPKVRAQRYSLARKEAWLRQNQAGFALFERAQQAKSLGPPIHSVKQSSAVRQMTRYKEIESNAHWMRKDYNASLQSGLDIVQMGYDFQRGGDAVSFSAGNSFNHMSRDTTGDTIEYLNATQARVAARRVEQLLAARWTLAQALTHAKHGTRQEWVARFKNPSWRTDALAFRLAFRGPLTWHERLCAQTISKRQIMADLDALYARAILDTRLPYGTEGVREIAPNNPFACETRTWLSLNPFGEVRTLTADRVLMLRLALRAYQLEHGAPPPDLQTLVPAYLEAVPLDPFGKGAPFRYKTAGKTYILWSIGPDGRDDGGKPIPWFKNKKAPTRYADEREKLPFISSDSPGDYVAGKNH